MTSSLILVKTKALFLFWHTVQNGYENIYVKEVVMFQG